MASDMTVTCREGQRQCDSNMNEPIMTPARLNGNQRAANRAGTMVVVPARLASTRLPSKLLLNDTGQSVLAHTLGNVLQARHVHAVCVATPDEPIAVEAERMGVQVCWSDPLATCGTERVAAVARDVSDVELFINVQADEPELPPPYIDQLVELMLGESEYVIGTLAAPLRESNRLASSSCVKVVMNRRGEALYFSRSPIPFVRDGQTGSRDQCSRDPAQAVHWQHLGIYAYRRSFLLQYPEIPVCRLEQAEQLEQLRFLDAGYRIRVGLVPEATQGIDTADDYVAFVKRMPSTKH